MQWSLDNKTGTAYREVFHQTRVIQESGESVVPDTDDDIGRIAGVDSAVYLKSKDVTARGVTVTGEAVATVLYINEERTAASFVKISRQFTAEYEVPGIDPDCTAQILLSILNVDVRMINPRKLSAGFEISGEVFCYKAEELETESSLPASADMGVYIRNETEEVMVVNSICEKTAAVTEQFSFPAGKPVPERIICGKTELNVTDSQLIGSRVIIKGNAEIRLMYLSEACDYPVQAEFSTPFSQIMETGRETMENCSIRPELTNAYYDLIDSVTGEKALSVEVHCVIQLVSRARQTVKYVSDLYSNRVEMCCARQKCCFSQVSAITKQRLTAAGRVRVADDCRDVLSVSVTSAKAALSDERLTAGIFADIIYRDTEGKLNSVRRSIEAEAAEGMKDLRIECQRLTDIYIRPDGCALDLHCTVEVMLAHSELCEYTKVTGFEADEDKVIDASQLPAVNMVLWEGESVWELAKAYHSSEELIMKYNEMSNETAGKMLLIPRAQ